MRHVSTLLAFVVLGICLSGPAWAADEMESSMPAPPVIDEALKSAMDSCKATAAKDMHGEPDRVSMDACLAAKGVAKPAGVTHKPPPPPPLVEDGVSSMPPPPSMGEAPPSKL